RPSQVRVMPDLLIATRVLHFAATTTLAGGTFFLAAVAEPAFDRLGTDAHLQSRAYRYALQPVLWIALVIAVLSRAGWLTAVSDNIGAASPWRVLVETRFGQVWIARLLMLFLLLWFMARSWSVLSTLAAMTLMASLAWLGHAAGSPGGLGSLHRAADLI